MLVKRSMFRAIFTLLLMLTVSPAIGQTVEPVAPIEGTVLTPVNQDSLSVLVYVLERGCQNVDQRFVELQYPATFEGEAARAAQLIVDGESGQSLDLFIHQKNMGKGVLISNLCLTEEWLARARLTLIFGGAGTTANLLIDNFALWPVEK